MQGDGKGAGVKRTQMKRSRRPIPFRSAKRAAIADERRAFVARILSERPTCEAPFYLRAIVNGLDSIDQPRVVAALRIGGAMCRSEEVHEVLSRARGGSIVEDDNVAALCHEHHRWVTEHPRLAALAGLSKSRWQT